LIAKHSIQDVSKVATPEKKHFHVVLVKRLMADEGDGRSIADGVEVSRRKGMNWMQHWRFSIVDGLSMLGRMVGNWNIVGGIKETMSLFLRW
jgi:hypothetical protein